jgi:hypothetical protein
MTETMDKATTRRGPTGKQTTFGGLLLAFLVAFYAFAQPILNERMGWGLPALPQTGSPAVVETQAQATGIPPTKSVATQRAEPNRERTAEPVKKKSGPLAERSSGSSQSPSSDPTTSSKVSSATKPRPNPTPAVTTNKEITDPPIKSIDTKDPSLLYGLLKDIGGERYLSPAGLMFTSGSAEGHRLDHLERHTVDDPQRPGKHGVFDGGMEGALATLDRAYQRALTNTKTTKEVDEGRTIYTVDMGSRVGYIGGRDGNRQNKPMARRVRMVLDRDRVITAYPL